jgi:hypothetical protein
MGMSKARRAREEAGLVERTKKEEEAYQQRLVELDELVRKYDDAAARWDRGMGPAKSKEEMFQAMTPLHEGVGWWTLLEFYRRNRAR